MSGENERASGDADPERSRPETESSYGIPATAEGMLPWRHVEARMRGDRTYWVVTTRPDGRAHARPVWGVWIDGSFHCGGGERTRWARNLAENPEIVVHRESGEDVVILEGIAEKIAPETGADPALVERVDAAYEAKYGMRHGTPFWVVRPRVALAWSDYPEDATRWRFEE
ncbi:pyridoxamine 5'-phosphate oxidase family protein [Halegenticoccus tardaugens]|uniref:pyridoxamine 5'-phosphate oxidase family protein n=1 Tax=Halegenticoccus tardaugens TaxID=2071624 RepID=UPI001E45129E|nr:pyridoxamine 5'-phosphate oxidase family protein [Halegenticoccus tardaugens]